MVNYFYYLRHRPDPDTGILKVILHHRGIWPKTIHHVISQKDLDRFRWNFLERLVVRRGQIYWSLMKIRIWIQSFFLCHSSPLSDRAKIDMSRDISKSCGRIMRKFGVWIGYVTRTSRLDLGSGLDVNRPFSGIQNVNCSARWRLSTECSSSLRMWSDLVIFSFIIWVLFWGFN